MAFGNSGYAPHPHSKDASAKSQTNLQYAVARSEVPWVITPFAAATAAADSDAYVIFGRDTHSVIVYAPATAPASFSLEIWGSHTNLPKSYVKVQTITALGETKVSAQYAYLVFSLQAIGTPAGGITVEVSSYRP